MACSMLRWGRLAVLQTGFGDSDQGDADWTVMIRPAVDTLLAARVSSSHNNDSETCVRNNPCSPSLVGSEKADRRLYILMLHACLDWLSLAVAAEED